MKIGLQLPWYDFPSGTDTLGSSLAQIARTADAGGFSSIWVMDHFFMLPFNNPPFPRANTVEDPMLESYATLAFLAGQTEHVRLGAMVTGVNYRYPGMLIKTVTTLDVLSGGRAWFGIGAGWFERESRGLGAPFPPTAERFEMLEETVLIAKQMWRDGSKATPFEGKHFHLDEPISSPGPVSKPHPPILIGGSGERKTLRLVAQHADACNLYLGAGPAQYGQQIEEVRHKIAVLQRHCNDVGRDIATIEITALATVHLADDEMSAADVLDLLRSAHDAGVQHVIFNMPNAYELTPIETIGREIIPVVAEW